MKLEEIVDCLIDKVSRGMKSECKICKEKKKCKGPHWYKEQTGVIGW